MVSLDLFLFYEFGLTSLTNVQSLHLKCDNRVKTHLQTLAQRRAGCEKMKDSRAQPVSILDDFLALFSTIQQAFALLQSPPVCYNHFKTTDRRRQAMDPFVKFENVKKVYKMGEVYIEALRDATFEISKGEICVIVGPSGAGKTTLLNILGGMDTLTAGKVWLDGKEISKYSQKQLTSYRRFDIGFVFQFYNLVQNLTALENVSLATQICKNPMDSAEALEKVGLGDRMNNFPSQLSGGEQQRVAIARALAKNPKLLLCDEPTGALDYNTGKAILKLLQDTARQSEMTVVIITHNLAIAPMADRVIHVKNGTVDGVEINAEPMPVEKIEW